MTERFDGTCLTCTITYTHRVVVPGTSITGSVLSTVTTRALSTLPQDQPVTYDGRQTTVQIGVPTPFLVDTPVPLPNLPSVDLPSLSPVDLPLPSLPAPVPTPPATPVPPVPDQAPAAPQVSGVDGTGYAYDLDGGAAEMAPSGDGAAAFDPSVLLPGAAAGTGTGAGSGPGPGGVAGGHDGAAVPVSGALEALGGTALDEESSTVSADGAATGPGLPLPALLAVVALAGATAALVRRLRAVRAR
ncbi:hypothetical protein SAMN05660657_04521 [Geodermatophilus amargosae]|uniref:Uncharacterized protein n=1 Tax=Geodermatophilus amargosae TaxID=1296565 RepID=A0A1I7CIQ2_9ACTN|nr:hypothetical protein [Geodermatophilus amargosae]SFT99259.1 hypothetical protein SAMN05660657_04521 [Geodermatophilus amargosae]